MRCRCWGRERTQIGLLRAVRRIWLHWRLQHRLGGPRLRGLVGLRRGGVRDGHIRRLDLVHVLRRLVLSDLLHLLLLAGELPFDLAEQVRHRAVSAGLAGLSCCAGSASLSLAAGRMHGAEAEPAAC